MVERRTGDRLVLGSNPAGGTSLRNFGNCVYSALPASFEGDTKSRGSLHDVSASMPREVKYPTLVMDSTTLMLNAHLPTGSRQLAISPTAD